MVVPIFRYKRVRMRRFRRVTTSMMVATNPPISTGEVIMSVTFCSTAGFWRRKLKIYPDWASRASRVMNNNISTSMILSVTTVPIRRAKEIFSYLARTPQREISPMRG